MEALGLLEKKIKDLIELVAKLRQENALLKTENAQLLQKVESAKNDELSQEKALTKMVVDDLIKSIDSLVEEHQQ